MIPLWPSTLSCVEFRPPVCCALKIMECGENAWYLRMESSHDIGRSHYLLCSSRIFVWSGAHYTRGDFATGNGCSWSWHLSDKSTNLMANSTNNTLWVNFIKMKKTEVLILLSFKTLTSRFYLECSGLVTLRVMPLVWRNLQTKYFQFYSLAGVIW